MFQQILNYGYLQYNLWKLFYRNGNRSQHHSISEWHQINVLSISWNNNCLSKVIRHFFPSYGCLCDMISYGCFCSRYIYYVYMSNDGPHTRNSPFWRHSAVRFTCLKVIRRLVNKRLYGVGKHVCWCTDFTNLAIAVHASNELGVVNYGCCTL